MSEHNTNTVSDRTPSSWGMARAIDSNYLAAADLQGHDVTVEIESVEIAEFDSDENSGDKEHANVVRFKGKEKAWRLNRTNEKCLEIMFGSNPRDAIGKRVTLTAETVMSFGERTLAIRVAGSPDIARPITVQVPAGKRGKKARTLRVTTPSSVKPVPSPLETPKPIDDEAIPL